MMPAVVNSHAAAWAENLFRFHGDKKAWFPCWDVKAVLTDTIVPIVI
jgi:hypothetical protein